MRDELSDFEPRVLFGGIGLMAVSQEFPHPQVPAPRPTSIRMRLDRRSLGLKGAVKKLWSLPKNWPG
jgi:hypothetical protein